MAFKIKTKTGTSAPASGVLDVGELGFDTTNKKLYVGNGTGQSATEIGSSYSLPLSANGTRGGIQIGATQTETNRAVILTSEKASVALPRQIPAVTLNGSSSTAPSFYAPTTAGTSNYVLKSNGTSAPTWGKGIIQLFNATSGTMHTQSFPGAPLAFYKSYLFVSNISSTNTITVNIIGTGTTQSVTLYGGGIVTMQAQAASSYWSQVGSSGFRFQSSTTQTSNSTGVAINQSGTLGTNTLTFTYSATSACAVYEIIL